MSVTQVPSTATWECDGCHGKEETVNADSRPKHWSTLHVKRDAYDFQDAPVADASIERDLCPECTDNIINIINDFASAQ
jgi:hypothetical protein